MLARKQINRSFVSICDTKRPDTPPLSAGGMVDLVGVQKIGKLGVCHLWLRERRP